MKPLAGLSRVFLFALPVYAGWNALPAPRIPEGTVLRDWRGTETSRLIADDSGALYLYLGDTLYRGRDHGADWSVFTTCPYGEAVPVYKPLLLTRDDWLICNRKISTDRGRSWSETSGEIFGMMWLTLIPGDRFLGSRYYGQSLWLSVDTGSTFDQVGGMRDRYGSFAEAGVGRYLVAGASSSLPGYYSDMLYSPDGGYTWNPLVMPSGDTVEAVRAYLLAEDPHPSEGTVYGLSGSGGRDLVYAIHWREGGIHVETRSANADFPDSVVTCFRAVRIPGGNGTRLWVGTWGQGLFSSDDGGVSWHRANDGLSDLHVGGLAVSGEDLFALTREGLYRADVATGIRGRLLHGNRGTAGREDGPSPSFPGPGRDDGIGARFRIDGRRTAAPARSIRPTPIESRK